MDNGLTKVKVLELKKEYGNNEISSKKRFVGIKMFLSQFNNPLVFILLSVSLISVLLGEYIDAILMFVIVLFNSILGFIQEFRAYNSIEGLKQFLIQETTVIRDRIKLKINTIDLVPGDKVLLYSGDKIPADGKLINSTNLLVNESFFLEKIEQYLKKEMKM